MKPITFYNEKHTFFRFTQSNEIYYPFLKNKFNKFMKYLLIVKLSVKKQNYI